MLFEVAAGILIGSIVCGIAAGVYSVYLEWNRRMRRKGGMVKKGNPINAEGLPAQSGEQIVGMEMKIKDKGNMKKFLRESISGCTAAYYFSDDEFTVTLDYLSEREEEERRKLKPKKKMRIEDFTPAKAGERYLDV